MRIGRDTQFGPSESSLGVLVPFLMNRCWHGKGCLYIDAAGTERCGFLGVTWVSPHPPQDLLPPQETVHPTLHTKPRSVPSGSKPNKINQSNVLKCWLFCTCGDFTTLYPTSKNPLQHNPISFGSQKVSTRPWRCACSLQMTHYINHVLDGNWPKQSIQRQWNRHQNL